MNTAQIVSAVLSLAAGIGIFLVACSMMSKNLESAGSSTLKRLFAKASSSRLLGVGIGAIGTAAIQSSGATTVMVIGFLNAGIMTLAQAATIIFGANIGTTITAHIVSLGMFGSGAVSTTVIFSAFAGIGAFITMLGKTERVRTLGGIITGFGMLFVGLSIMSGAMDSFSQLDEIKTFLAGINSGLLLILVGTILTALIQSSSVMTSIALTLVVSGLISLDQGIYLTMGSNIGSCVVALIACIGGSRDAKRAALIHLTFNICGVVLFSAIGVAMRLFSSGGLSLGTIFKNLFPNAPQTQLAMFHTVFNVVAAAAALPLTGAFVALSLKLIPSPKNEGNKLDPGAKKVYYIDDNLLVTPPVAVAQAKNEIVNMADIAMRNFALSLDMIQGRRMDEAKAFAKAEDELNYLNAELVSFLSKLSRLNLNASDSAFVTSSFRTVSDIERIGDYAENIVEYAEHLRRENEAFSETACIEVRRVGGLIEKLFGEVIAAYRDGRLKAVSEALETEDEVDELTDQMAKNHIERLNAGVCTPNAGAQYLSLSSDAERVADHLVNIVKTVWRSNMS